MATYKVIQDIEAEDHILGPLTLRQFIYALVTIFFGYLSFVVIDKHVFFMLLFFVPPGVLFGFLAFPFGRDQPNEVWALARLRFILKPRRRLWNQSGAKELVSVTAPKREGRQLTNGLTKAEVNNRLQALALMIDSRGWAIKNLATKPNPTQAQTKAKDPAILNLANNNDLNVATIASEAKRSSASNEVVINLR